MAHWHGILLAVTVMSLCWPQSRCACTCNTLANRQYLQQFYNTLGGASWKPSVNLTLPICNWGGVTCEGSTGDIKRVDLSSRGMQGNLSEVSLDLAVLVSLNVSNNPLLTGRLDAIVLPQLSTLDMSFTAVSGTLPASWKDVRLVVLALEGCRNITGTLPPDWGTAPSPLSQSLKILRISSPSLSGAIPSEWASLSNLRVLSAAGSTLSGSLPSWCFSNTLSILNLSLNSFSGTLPATLPNPTDVLDLSHNTLLGGSLPSLFPNGMSSLVLRNCSFSGALPASLPYSLKLFDVAWNNLSGALTNPFGTLSIIERCDLSGNSLTGSLSARWFPMRLISLNVSRNGIAALPLALFSNRTEQRNVESIDLSHNNISGPFAIPVWSFLCALSAAANKLQGPIPSLVGSSLLSLDLSDNRFNGSLPSALPPSLTVLNLAGNNISGSLPSQWGSAVALATVDISRNPLLVGPLPAAWGMMNGLLSLSINGLVNLSAAIPLYWCRTLFHRSFPTPNANLSAVGVSFRFPNRSVVTVVSSDDAYRVVKASCHSVSVSDEPTRSASVSTEDSPSMTTYTIVPPSQTRFTVVHLTNTVETNSMDSRSGGSVSSTVTKPSISSQLSMASRSLSHSRSATRLVAISYHTFTFSGSVKGAFWLSTRSSSVTVGSGSRTVSPSLTHGLPRTSYTVARVRTVGHHSHRVTVSPSASLSSHSSSLTATASETCAPVALVPQDPKLLTANSNDTAAAYSYSTGLYSAATNGPLEIRFSLTNTSPAVSVRSVTSYGTVQTTSVGADGLMAVLLSVPQNIADFSTDQLAVVTVLMGTVDQVCNVTVIDIHLHGSPLLSAADILVTASALTALGGPTAQQSMLTFELSLCAFSDYASLPLTYNPTQLSISAGGSLAGASFRGAVVGNVLVNVGCVAVGLGASLFSFVMFVRPAGLTFHDAMAVYGLPGRFHVVFLFLLQPTVSCSVVVLQMAGAVALNAVVGSLGIAFVLAGLFVFAALIRKWTQALTPVPRDPVSALDRVVGRCTFWMTDEPGHDHRSLGVWKDIKAVERDSNDCDELPVVIISLPPVMPSLEARRFDSMFGRMRWNRKFYFLVEQFFAICFGAIGGLRPRSGEGCRHAQVALSVVTGLQVVVLVVARPYENVVEQCVKSVVALCAFVSVVLIAENVNDIGGTIALVSVMITVLFSIVKVANATHVRCSQRREPRRRLLEAPSPMLEKDSGPKRAEVAEPHDGGPCDTANAHASETTSELQSIDEESAAVSSLSIHRKGKVSQVDAICHCLVQEASNAPFAFEYCLERNIRHRLMIMVRAIALQSHDLIS